MLPLSIAAATAAPAATPAPGAGGMSPRDMVMMALFALSMLVVGYLVWRLVNWKDPPERS